ncbi:MAG: ABC transporter permease [Ilumatobacteraceae bacterium]
MRALERVTAAPLLLGAVLALLVVVGCAYTLASSIRARRRDLAILRSLGSNDRQLRAIVYWQASIVAAMIMVVGVPVGIVVGRSIVSLLTNALGIVPGAEVPVLLVIAAIGAALLVANAIAVLPAHRAVRTRVAQLTLDH